MSISHPCEETDIDRVADMQNILSAPGAQEVL
jgi:hypothetical protein